MGIITKMKGWYKSVNGNYKYLEVSENIEYERGLRWLTRHVYWRKYPAPWHFLMQVTLGAQTRDTITAVGKDTGSKKKNTLFIREETLSVLEAIHRGMHSSRPSPHPALPPPQRPPPPAAGASAVSHRQCLTIPSLVAESCFFFFFTYITGEEMDPPADATEASLVCARGLCKWDACVAKRNRGF